MKKWRAQRVYGDTVGNQKIKPLSVRNLSFILSSVSLQIDLTGI
jgi:hypothetical protein